MSINKRFLQLFAALWILLFHLWIPLSGTQLEQYLIKIGYVGVDLFFFLTAYSLADKKINYPDFLKNRFGTIYVKFILFVLIAAVYKHWSFLRTIKVLGFIELFERGGGSFLWFIPAIMLFYLIYPFFIQWNNQKKEIIVLISWFVTSYLIDKCGYSAIFIFTNRIPVILAGYWIKHHKINPSLALTGIPIGLLLLYIEGFTKKMNVPFHDVYFVLAVPFVIGIAAASTYVKENKVITLLSCATLEVYAFQMIFGSGMVTKLYRATGSKLVTNLAMLTITFAISILANKCFNYAVHKLKDIKK